MIEHGLDLTSWAVVISIAVAVGLVLIRLRLPSMVAFILTGAVLGPTGFGLVKNLGAVNVLAEIGVLSPRWHLDEMVCKIGGERVYL